MTRVYRLLEQNTQGRDFVVGDVHGYYQPLMQALEAMAFDFEQDRLLSVGDLIDRGPDSLRCLELLKQPWFFAVQGNHEGFLLQTLAGDQRAERIWLANGGEWSQDLTRQELETLAQLISEQMPLAMEVHTAWGALGLVHAEVPEDNWELLRWSTGAPDEGWLETLTSRRTRVRHEFCVPVEHIDAVACGHTLVEKPLRLGNVHYLETGICAPQLGGYLTLLPVADLFSA